METEPDTQNVCYMDEYRKARWLSDLKRARDAGQMALFGVELENPGQLILFPVASTEEWPDELA